MGYFESHERIFMKLSTREESLLKGDLGSGFQKAIEILLAYGEACDAKRMIPVTSTHIAGNYSVMMDEGVEWLEELAREGTKVSVFTTKNPEQFDFEDANEMKVPIFYQEVQHRIDEALRSLGVTLTYTCHHYLVGNLPRFGDHIAWASSGSQVFANSVIGARSNRDGDHVVLAAAITGVIPEWGLHLTENRRGQILIDTGNLNLDELAIADYHALGWHLGKIVSDRIPVFTNLPPDLSIQKIKGLLYSLTVTGSVGLVHLVGITPEANTLEEAFGGHVQPADTISVEMESIEKAYGDICSSTENKVDLVIFGCPQCTIQEIQEIASLLEGRKVHPDTELWICTSRWMKTLAERMGLINTIKKAGGRIVADTGAACGPYLYLPERGIRVVAINSARANYYAHNVTGMETWFGSTEDLIETAIAGRWRGKS
jgi:predicted aconitase